ncbi:MAG: type II and III secretion system protein family protein [Hyphomicrobiales bacterium]
MTRSFLAMLLAFAMTFALMVLPQPAAADANKFVRLGLGKTMVVRLPANARDVLVGDPKIADVVVRTANTAYLFAKGVGQTNAFFFDASGRQILNLNIDVGIDGQALQELLRKAVPNAQINVDTVNNNVILGGTAPNAADAQRAVDLAQAFVQSNPSSSSGGSSGGGSSGGGSSGGSSGGAAISASPSSGSSGPSATIVNNIAITGNDQVMIRVRVVEMNREVLKQFGISTAALLQSGGLKIGFANTNDFKLNGNMDPGAFLPRNCISLNCFIGGGLNTAFSSDGNTLDSVLKAYERDQLTRTLAEPTLTAISGESAKFLAGGEFPIPVSQQNNTTTIEYKPFGVGLGFAPVVMSEGRISMKISTEVSEPTPLNSFTLGSANTDATLDIPGLKVRRAETTVELPSGGSMVMAGLIQEDTKQALAGMPGIKDLPVLGTLFRSRDYKSNETELVVIVTPYVVKPVNESKLATPLDNYNTPSDRQTIIWGRLNKIYGAQNQQPKGVYHGNVGYIVE